MLAHHAEMTRDRSKIVATEKSLRDKPSRPPAAPPIVGIHPITSAVVHGAARIADQLNAQLVVVATSNGGSAVAKSSQRDFVPAIVVSNNEIVLRPTSLRGGIIPVSGAPTLEGARLTKFLEEWGFENQILKTGGQVVVVAGSHNRVVVHQIIEREMNP